MGGLDNVWMATATCSVAACPSASWADRVHGASIFDVEETLRQTATALTWKRWPAYRRLMPASGAGRSAHAMAWASRHLGAAQPAERWWQSGMPC